MSINYHHQLLDRLNNRTATIGVVGLGYVGLPLAVAFAEVGFQVIGVDVSPHKIEQLQNGESYIIDTPSAQLAPLISSGKLQVSTEYEALRNVDAMSICVPTPLRKTKDPDMSYIMQAADGIEKIAHAGMMISLESTTYPGTTEEIIVPRLTNQGLTVGEDVFVVFSPERIDPANKTYHVRNIPRVVGGVSPACQEIGEAYYKAIIENVHTVSSTTTAEMVKLLENTFRAVNIGLANEVALMCDRLGIDVWEVINAAATKPFGFMPHYPGPGLGGHCIPLDPHYLSWKLKTLNYNARFIELASEINTSMPFHVVDKITDALNEKAKSVRNSRIGVLGVAYKANVDDVRESPALDIIQILQEKGAIVEWNDPHVDSIRLQGDTSSKGVACTPEWLESLDCAVVITNHEKFDWELITGHSNLIVDTRNATNGFESHARIIGLSPRSIS